MFKKLTFYFVDIFMYLFLMTVYTIVFIFLPTDYDRKTVECLYCRTEGTLQFWRSCVIIAHHKSCQIIDIDINNEKKKKILNSYLVYRLLDAVLNVTLNYSTKIRRRSCES